MIGVYPHTVSVRDPVGRDTRGQPIYRDSVTMRARIEYRTRLITTATGETVTSRMRVHLPQAVALGALVTVDGTEYPVLAPDGTSDITGRISAWSVSL